MQISEFRDLLANDGFAATFQTMGQYRTELLRALDKLRAQADARPVAVVRSVINAGDEGVRVKWLGGHPQIGAKLYTYPVEAATGPSIDEMAREFSAMSEDVMGEMLALLHKRIEAHSGRQMQASAPGLSDEDIFELWCSIPTQGSVDEDIVPFARALLTRASAATVAEPSEVRHPISGQTLEELWLETGKLRSQIADLQAAQQQAKTCQYPNCGCDSRAKCTSNFNGAPKTVEASAPGLSDTEILKIAREAAPPFPWGIGTTSEIFLQAVRAILTRASAATVGEPSKTAAVPVELMGVKEANEEGGGQWRTCTGCYESEDGHPVGRYHYSDVMGCTLGGGCQECGGIGAVWDTTDYNAMAEHFMKLEEAEEAAQQQAEPGADERAAFEADYFSRYGESVYLGRREDGQYMHGFTQSRWLGWQARAAQSGQRAAVAMIPQDALADLRMMYHTCARAVHYMHGSDMDKLFLRVESLLWPEECAAAPTQQQEDV